VPLLKRTVRTGCTRLAPCAVSPNWRNNGLVFRTIGTTVDTLNAVNRHFKPLPKCAGFHYIRRRDLDTTGGLLVAVMAALGVISAWGVLHSSFALHYAYLYYRSEESAGGLAFPSEQSPDQLDFAYFAFTIAVSFAASDVDVTDRAIRRTVLGHQVLSFFFNASILALVINLFARA
jgi:hypothetical protein